jgi:nitrate reductase delta subunit
MRIAEVVASGYRYPTPSAAAELSAAIDGIPGGVVERHMRQFFDEVSDLSLGEWEELHTATLDLSPLFVPYVGHVTWGENYRRGEFMADMKGSMTRNGIDLGGELPDHIEPILRYLARVDDPLPDLVEVLPKAVDDMQDTLAKASSDNPYRHLLAATVAFAADLRPVTIGSRR